MVLNRFKRYIEMLMKLVHKQTGPNQRLFFNFQSLIQQIQSLIESTQSLLESV